MLVNGEKPTNNVTVLQCFNNKRNNNVTMLNNVRDNKSFKLKQEKTEFIAKRLVEKYSAPEWKKFFLKVAWHLSEDAIWAAVEMSSRECVEKKLNYFIAACNRQM